MAAGRACDQKGEYYKLIATSEANGYPRPGVIVQPDEVRIRRPERLARRRRHREIRKGERPNSAGNGSHAPDLPVVHAEDV